MTVSSQAAIGPQIPFALSALRISNVKPALVMAISAVILFAAWVLPHDLTDEPRIALAVTALAIVGWTLTPLPDSVVAVSAALALVLTGVVPDAQLYATLGRELVWLLLAAFVIAAVVKTSGLMQRLAFAAVSPFSGLTSFFHAVTFVIALTAFLIPSTSGRAALLLPVFMALADRMPGKASERALALLFPTVILLSAGGSIIGAGAHLVAVEAIDRSAGVSIGYVEWLMLAFPLTLFASHTAATLILLLFVPRKERTAVLSGRLPSQGPTDARQWRILAVLTCIVTLWITAPWHGVDIALVAVGGAVLLLTGPFTAQSPKQVFRQVEVELLVFLTATVVIADGIILSGASKWMAGAALDLLPASARHSTPLVVFFLASTAVLSHLIINSRSARAAVLLPAVTLPLAGLGHDVVTLALVTVLGTGFCQTMMASAKPVALFGNADRATFDQSDLLRLAIPLLPVKIVMITAFALFVWPHQLPESRERPTETASPVDVEGRTAPKAHSRTTACTAQRLNTMMLATIRDRAMWAAGWWHVWDRLRRDGYPIERGKIRKLYRGGDMVLLRAHSPRLYAPDVAPTAVAAAQQACRIPAYSQVLPDRIPIPKPRQPSD